MATLRTGADRAWAVSENRNPTERWGFSVLTLCPARTLTCFLEPRLLAFHLARIASEEACFLQFLAEVGVEEFQRAGDTVADRIGLPRDTAAVDLRGFGVLRPLRWAAIFSPCQWALTTAVSTPAAARRSSA